VRGGHDWRGGGRGGENRNWRKVPEGRCVQGEHGFLMGTGWTDVVVKSLDAVIGKRLVRGGKRKEKLIGEMREERKSESIFRG